MKTANYPNKYDSIGSGYNTTRKPDAFLTSRMSELLDLNPSDYLLDIGCGTGNYTSTIKHPHSNIFGVDPSTLMLKVAEKHSPNINWKLGSAERIPLGDNRVNKTLASLTLHHWNSLKDGFKELDRVNKPKSKMLIFTSTSEQTAGYWLNEYFPLMMKDSVNQMPSYSAIIQNLEKSNWEILKEEKYFIKDDIEDKFLYSGKHSPTLYFDQNIRSGISSFSHLSNQEEVNKGLIKLRDDIDSGEILNVQQRYENDLGDYLFILAQNL